MSFYDGRDPADLRMPRDFYLPRLRRTRHVHLSIMNFGRFLYEDIEDLGVPVSTDLHDWDGLADHHREFALRSDLVFFSAAGVGDEAPALMREILRAGRAHTVVATAGADGSYVLTRDGDPDPVTFRRPSRPLRWWTPTARATRTCAASCTAGSPAGTYGSAPGSGRSRVPTPVRHRARPPSSPGSRS